MRSQTPEQLEEINKALKIVPANMDEVSADVSGAIVSVHGIVNDSDLDLNNATDGQVIGAVTAAICQHNGSDCDRLVGALKSMGEMTEGNPLVKLAPVLSAAANQLSTAKLDSLNNAFEDPDLVAGAKDAARKMPERLEEAMEYIKDSGISLNPSDMAAVVATNLDGVADNLRHFLSEPIDADKVQAAVSRSLENASRDPSLALSVSITAHVAQDIATPAAP